MGHVNQDVQAIHAIWLKVDKKRSIVFSGQAKVEIRKIVKIIRLNQEEWLDICAMFFKDQVHEMMSNASCVMILFHVNN